MCAAPGRGGAGARAAAPLLGVRRRGSPGCPVLGPVFVPGAAEGGVTPAGLAAPRRAARRTRCSGRVVTASPATRALARSVTRSSELWHTGRLSRDVYRVAAWRFSVETEASRRASSLKVWTRRAPGGSRPPRPRVTRPARRGAAPPARLGSEPSCSCFKSHALWCLRFVPTGVFTSPSSDATGTRLAEAAAAGQPAGPVPGPVLPRVWCPPR